MEKLAKMSMVVGILIVLVMAVGFVRAAPLSQAGIPGEPEPEPEIGRPGERESEPGDGEGETEIIGPVTDGASLNGPGPDEANPAGAAIRINFEVAGHAARRGLYVVQEIGGNVIASWYALEGWTDSGWFENVEISAEYVQLRVFYYPGPNTNPTEMRILNPAPGTNNGWVSRDVGHAIEVAWPDMPVEGFDSESVDSEL